MSRFISYLNNASKIISEYKGDIPFASYLKQYFSKEKKYGSKDRKQIASLCYSYFRAGHLFTKKNNPENILAATFLCTQQPYIVIDHLKPEWSAKTGLPIEEKLALIKNNSPLSTVFPFSNDLNESIDKTNFYWSLFSQPSVFIRIRNGYHDKVIAKLNTAGIVFNETNNCLKLPAGTSLETILYLNKEAVIQDYNSQKVLDYLVNVPAIKTNDKPVVWDCCAASGGKSILLSDKIKTDFHLTVSDIRPSIIHNLKKRFQEAGIRNFRSIIADLTKPVEFKTHDKFDIIICDAPCTGSGTWSRAPEQLYFFNQNSITEFSDLQKRIVGNVIPHLKENGLLFYITCSVFKKENEQVASFINTQFKLELQEMKNLYGYHENADSMFVAVFKKQKIQK